METRVSSALLSKLLNFMKTSLISLLRCPASGQHLFLESDPTLFYAHSLDDDIESGFLSSVDLQYRYKIHKGIPRFVPSSNYADSFGLQWNHFANTQLDSHSGRPISAHRFWRATRWIPAEMAGRWVLDVGCGSGRFAEIALNAGAYVIALDYSDAVDACYANLRSHPNFHVVQCDIYSLPFAPGIFDFVYSLGVLQHTPDVQRAFFRLPPLLTSHGGRPCVDFYERVWWKLPLHPKFWLRPFTTRMNRNLLFAILQKCVPTLMILSNALGSVPVVGKALKRFVPVANYTGILPLSETQLCEWALLDTFDWLAPVYDNPQTRADVKRWLGDAGLSSVEVLKIDHLVGRGVKV